MILNSTAVTEIFAAEIQQRSLREHVILSLAHNASKQVLTVVWNDCGDFASTGATHRTKTQSKASAQTSLDIRRKLRAQMNS